METKQRGSFTGSLGFILAAAGSAVGLGNLWRFPIVAAKDGGALFLLIYILLTITFGFALLTTEIAIGRKTQSAPVLAYGMLDKRFGFLGSVATLVPIMILPYYCVIGGWVSKYAFSYLTVNSFEIYENGTAGFFTSFITAQWEPIIWFLVFLGITALVVSLGVEKGIEGLSKVLMPALFILVIGIAIYSLTLSHTDANGVTRTALEGLKVYLIPDFSGITLSKFLTILLDATGQMFYSLSIAMGIMITYGSYSKKDTNLVKSVNQISLFDTGVAFIAGLIIIPTVFAFQGYEGLNTAGPSLMFISLPSIFEQMGGIGSIVGALFFLLVFFAALTSSLSIFEAVASCLIDKHHISRKTATIICLIGSILIGLTVCLGYNALYFELTLPNGSTGQILDLLDYISNNIMLPVVAFITCLLVAWFNEPSMILDEVAQGMEGVDFKRKGLYIVMMRFVAPVLLVIILFQAFSIF